MTASFYAPIFPMGLIMEGFGLFFYFWVQKYMFIQHSSISFMLSKVLNRAMIRVLSFVPLVIYTKINI